MTVHTDRTRRRLRYARAAVRLLVAAAVLGLVALASTYARAALP